MNLDHFLALFGLPLLGCVLMLGILGYLGIHVLRREVVFIDIAMAQTVVVGMIVAHLLFGAHGDSWTAYACGLATALLAAVFYAFGRSRAGHVPLEAIIGISYAIAAAAALFLVGLAPGGHIHIHSTLAGSVLWITWKDVGASAAIFGAVTVALFVFRKPFARISESYLQATDGGRKVVLWDILFYALAGSVIAWATRIAGVLLIFAFLIVPAVVSAIFSRRTGPRLLIGWAFALGATVMGLLFADRLDFSLGPSISLVLVAGLALAATSRVCGRIVTLGMSAAVVAAFVTLLFMGGRGYSLAHRRPPDLQAPTTSSRPAVRPPAGPSDDELLKRIRHAETVDEFMGPVLQAAKTGDLELIKNV